MSSVIIVHGVILLQRKQKKITAKLYFIAILVINYKNAILLHIKCRRG